MIETITREVQRCTCRKCKPPYIWDTLASNPPVKCPKCKARDWNTKAKLGRPRTVRVEMPKPKRVRLEN